MPPYLALIETARRLATHWCVCVSASAGKTPKIGQMALGFHGCQQCCCMICMPSPPHVNMHMNMGLLHPYYQNCEDSEECSHACRAPPKQPSNLQNLPKNCHLWEPMCCFRKAKTVLVLMHGVFLWSRALHRVIWLL